MVHTSCIVVTLHNKCETPCPIGSIIVNALGDPTLHSEGLARGEGGEWVKAPSEGELGALQRLFFTNGFPTDSDSTDKS